MNTTSDFFSTSAIARALDFSAHDFFDVLTSEGLLTKSPKTYDLTERGSSLGVYRYGENKSSRWPVWPPELLCNFLRNSGHNIPDIDYGILLAPPKSKSSPTISNKNPTAIPQQNYQREAQNLRVRLAELLTALGTDPNDPEVASWIRGVGYIDEVIAKMQPHI